MPVPSGHADPLLVAPPAAPAHQPFEASLEGPSWLAEATTPPARADLLAETLLADPLPDDSDAPPPWYEMLGYTLPPPCGIWRWTNTATAATIPFRCGRWSCPLCGYRRAREWCQILQFAPVQRHVVVTRLDDDQAAAALRFKCIVLAIRRGEAVEPDRRGRRRRRSFEYMATSESHARAGVHVHMLQHGDYIHQRLFGEMLDRYGAGRVNWVERIDALNRPRALARYITRHLVTVEHPYQPTRGARIRYSRRFFDPDGKISAVQIRAALHPPDPDSPWRLDMLDGDPQLSRRILDPQVYNGGDN